MKTLRVRKIWIQDRPIDCPGMTQPRWIYGVAGSVDLRVDNIEEHQAQGSGDAWSWLVTMSNGRSERYFLGCPGVYQVEYEQEDPESERNRDTDCFARSGHGVMPATGVRGPAKPEPASVLDKVDRQPPGFEVGVDPDAGLTARCAGRPGGDS